MEHSKSFKSSIQKSLKSLHYFSQLQENPNAPKPMACVFEVLELSAVNEDVIAALAEGALAANKPKGFKEGVFVLETAASGISTRRAQTDLAYYHSNAAWHLLLVGRFDNRNAAQYMDNQEVAQTWVSKVINQIGASGKVLGGYQITAASVRDPAHLYGGNMERLGQIKHTYDAGNLFSLTANVKPSEFPNLLTRKLEGRTIDGKAATARE